MFAAYVPCLRNRHFGTLFSKGVRDLEVGACWHAKTHKAGSPSISMIYALVR